MGRTQLSKAYNGTRHHTAMQYERRALKNAIDIVAYEKKVRTSGNEDNISF